MPEKEKIYKDPFIESISFLYYYLLMRLRNDKEGDFYIGLEEYKLLVEAASLQRNTLTIKNLRTLFCRLFAKSPLQELRLIQHYNIVLQEHENIWKVLEEAGLPGEIPVSGTAKNDDIADDIKKTAVSNNGSRQNLGFARKEEIKKQLAKITLSPVLDTGRYEVSQKYTPASKREMSIFSRRLQKGLNSYFTSDVLDIDKTVQSIARLGFFIQPVFASKKFKTKITVLVDNSASMIPFEKLIADFIISIKSSVQLNTLYFQNYPVRQLFKEKLGISSLSLKEWITTLNKNSFIIIVSDAGSARGGMNEKRVTNTQNWIRSMKEKTNRIIWLNPMPASRWMGTTSWELMNVANMYSFSRYNLEKAMEKLGL